MSNFGHLPRSAPKSVFRVTFFGPKKGQKALKKHSLGHSEAGAQNCSESTPWKTFRPGPPGTPVHGGRNRKYKHFIQSGGRPLRYFQTPVLQNLHWTNFSLRNPFFGSPGSVQFSSVTVWVWKRSEFFRLSAGTVPPAKGLF